MSRYGPLRGGASDLDMADPASVERYERRRAEAEAWADYQRALDEHQSRRLRDRDGMRFDDHPHDAGPRPPTLPPDQLERELDPTGRRRYEADASPHVIRTVRCTHPGCDVTGTFYGREDTLARTQAAGGPRCADHPLDPAALADTPTPQHHRAHGV